MSALPHTLAKYRPQPFIIIAYRIYLELECRTQRKVNLEKRRKNDELEMMYCRVLGYLFYHLPTRVVNDYLHFCQHFIKLFMFDKGATLKSSGSPSRQSVTEAAKGIMTELQEPSKNDQTAKKHCVVTKSYDAVHARGQREIIESGKSPAVGTRHTFPQSINANINSTSEKELNGANIHPLEYIVTMDTNIHLLFDGLNIWFTATVRLIFSLSFSYYDLSGELQSSVLQCV
ncbi:hypothetical protein EDC04DRAFT_2692988 [Pisolithus marmoratus]|nr:hypothetical protein EDC04DRAFT_2692988 [Pisolithus marmoratus]